MNKIVLSGTVSVAVSNKFRNMSILCALFVVIIHCRPPFECGTGMWWVKQMLECGICTIAVPFFFVSSGYFLAGQAEAKGWYVSALTKRVRTLVVPYFIWLTFFLLFGVALRLLGGHEIAEVFGLDNLRRFYGIALTGLPGLTPLWYVRGLLVLVMLSPLLLYVVKFRGGGANTTVFRLRCDLPWTCRERFPARVDAMWRFAYGRRFLFFVRDVDAS